MIFLSLSLKVLWQGLVYCFISVASRRPWLYWWADQWGFWSWVRNVQTLDSQLRSEDRGDLYWMHCSSIHACLTKFLSSWKVVKEGHLFSGCVQACQKYLWTSRWYKPLGVCLLCQPPLLLKKDVSGIHWGTFVLSKVQMLSTRKALPLNVDSLDGWWIAEKKNAWGNNGR